jgi:alkylation response protein AidB-like acyl-CoA dehydrogenase
MMRFAFTDEQEMLRAAVRGALERAIPPDRGREALEGGESELTLELAVRQEWTGIGVPEDAGGQGGGLVELAILFEELGRVPAPDAVLPLALADGLLAGLGDSVIELRAELVRGERTLAVAIPGGLLPGEGSICSTAFPTADACSTAWHVEGTIPLVLGPGDATALLVPARTPSGEALFLVETRDVELKPHALADLSRRAATVTLGSAPATPVADAVGDAMASLAPRAAVLVAADALGNGRHLLEMTVEYVSEREQFGVPVGSFQAVKHTAAEMLVELEAAHSAVYFAAWSVESDQDGAASHAAIAKWYATEAAVRAADAAHALHGAVAFTWEHDLHIHLKRARADAELFGSAQRQLAVIGRELQLGEVPPETRATALPVIT